MPVPSPAADAPFAQEFPWLNTQPGMTPWAGGVARLADELTRFATKYTAAVGVPWPDPARGPETPAAYTAAIWRCWAYHWEQAAIDRGRPADGWKLAQELTRPERPGGDLFRGVVLAQAMLCRHKPAHDLFAKEHLLPTARGCEPTAGYRPGDMPDWWPNLLDRLVGVSRPPGALAKYVGKSGLGAYVLQVAINERKGMTRSAYHRRAVAIDETAVAAPPRLDFLSAECSELLTRKLADAFASLTDEEQLLLKWTHRDGLRGDEVAGLLGVNPGTVTRRKQATTGRFREAVNRTVGRGSGADECVDHLIGEGRELSDVLLAALAGGGAA